MTTITIDKPQTKNIKHQLPPRSWLWSHSKDFKAPKEEPKLERNAMLIAVMNRRPRI